MASISEQMALGWDEPSNLRRSGAIELSDQDAGLFLRFSAEIKDAAICCINLLCYFNALNFSPQQSVPAGIAAFAPAPPQTISQVLASPIATLLKPATRAGQKGFARFLAECRDELEHILDREHLGTAPDAAAIERGSDVVVTAACFAKITLKDLVAIHRRLFREYDVAELTYLASLLDDTLQGQSPLIVNGKLVKVRTDFELRDVRVAINAEAAVSGSERVERVMVRNISQGGIGFEGAQHIATGETIDIRLASTGRRLTGRVVWKVGSKAGVELLERLEESDPLLEGAKRADRD